MFKGLVAGSLVASAAHFAHNAIFLGDYPGPLWIPGPWFVVGAWFVIAAVLLRGYAWYRAGRAKLALAAVSAYSLSCVLVFGHYLYGPPSQFDALANGLIFLEGTSGIVLFLYFVYMLRGRQPG